MKHTPGPWYVRQDREFYNNHAQPYCIATMPENEFDEDIWICRCMDMWDDEMKANARLISSAPEMLEILKNVWKCGDSIRHDSLIWKDIENVLKKLESI